MKNVILLLSIISFSICAQGINSTSPVRGNFFSLDNDYPTPEPDWGIAIGSRTATIPYKNSPDDTVRDFVPKMYYEGEYLFLRGETGGLRFWDGGKYSFSLLGRYRYFDIPLEAQKQYQGTNIDSGLQLEYLISENLPIQLELMTDADGRSYADLGAIYRMDIDDFDIELNTLFRYKSGEFNNIYYGLGDFYADDIGSDYDIKAGAKVRYHVMSNLYLLGELDLTMFGNKTYHSEAVADRFQTEYFLGFGFFNDKKNRGQLTLPSNHYLRLAHGWATPSNIGDIIRGNTEKDQYNNQLTSLFYGIPVAETLFTLPIQLYVTPGFAYHYNSDVQDPISEYVLAIKAYYTFTWPVRWRFGFAEGLSYVSEVTYIEQNDDPDETGTQFLNYLDFSLDINLGDVTTFNELDNLWLGYSIHHRSGIFETSSLFGRSKGGSNYNSLYLQWHF
nr:hypothetical protein BCCFPMHH_00007 [uncultured bacterium]